MVRPASNTIPEMEGLLDRLAALEDRHRELSLRVIDPEIIADPEAYRMAMQDYSELDPLVQRIRQYREADFALQAAREDARSEDAELRQMAADEVARLEALQARVEALGIFLTPTRTEHVMPGAGQAIAPGAAIPEILVVRLAVTGQPHDDIAGLDARVVDDFIAAHAADDGRVDDHRADEIAEVGGLPAGALDIPSPLAPLGHHFLGALDQSGDHLSRDEALVAADGRADEDGARRADTQ